MITHYQTGYTFREPKWRGSRSICNEIDTVLFSCTTTYPYYSSTTTTTTFPCYLAIYKVKQTLNLL
jgi:hypothetical protein